MGHFRLPGLRHRAGARRRSFIALASVALFAAACAQTPPERAPLPDVEGALDPPAQCTLLVGEPQGVLVEEVLADTAADGLLLAGDVILAIDGTPTPDADFLVEVMAGKAPGDEIDVEYTREELRARSTLTLGANPDDPDRAMIGVLIQTAYDTMLADEAAGPVTPGASTRPISIGDRIYLFDPATATWERTDVTVPADLDWVATSSGIYSMEEGTLTDLAADEDLDPGQLDGWEPIRSIGSIGSDLVLVATQPVPGDPEQATVGVARFDPVQMEMIWVEPVLDGFGIPISALGSPDRERIVLVGVNNDGTEITGVQVWDADGFDSGLDDLASLGAPVGWLDEDALLFRTDAETATELSTTSGEREELTLDPQISGLPLFPVGDGHGVLAVEGRALVLEVLGAEGEIRVLAQDCAINRVGEPGWGT